MLVDPDPQALVAAAEGAGIVVVGLTDRWRHEGLGRARTALATLAAGLARLLRRGLWPRRLLAAGMLIVGLWSIAARVGWIGGGITGMTTHQHEAMP